MKSVKRYILWPGDSINMPKFIEKQNGEWVKFEDYENLQKELATIKETYQVDKIVKRCMNCYFYGQQSRDMSHVCNMCRDQSVWKLEI